MKFSLFSLLVASLSGLSFTVLAADGKAPAVSITEQADRLRIELGGELFTNYIFKGEERFFPVFYPVMGPGEVPMTRRYPLEKSEPCGCRSSRCVGLPPRSCFRQRNDHLRRH